MIRLFITGYLVVLMGASVWAMRPLTTDDAGIVPKDKVQMEAGWSHARSLVESEQETVVFNETSGEMETIAVPCRFHHGENTLDLCLRHGVTERFDLGFFIPIMTPPDAEGSLGIVSKMALFKSGDLTAVSAAASFLPARGDWFVNGICTVCGGPLTAHLNLGYGAAATLNEGATFWGSAVEWPVAEPVALTAEVTGEVDRDTATDDPTEGFIGGYWAVCDGLTIDAGFGTLFQRAGEDWRLTGGTTLVF